MRPYSFPPGGRRAKVSHVEQGPSPFELLDSDQRRKVATQHYDRMVEYIEEQLGAAWLRQTYIPTIDVSKDCASKGLNRLGGANPRS